MALEEGLRVGIVVFLTARLSAALDDQESAGSAGLPAFLAAELEQSRIAIGAIAALRESDARKQVEAQRHVLRAAHVVELGHLAEIVLDALPAEPRVHEL